MILIEPPRAEVSKKATVIFWLQMKPENLPLRWLEIAPNMNAWTRHHYLTPIGILENWEDD